MNPADTLLSDFQPPDCTFLLLKLPVSGTLLFAPGNEWKPLISPYSASTFPVSAMALLHHQSLPGYVTGTQHINSLWVTEWPSQGRQKECRTELRERSLGVIHCVYVLELDLPLLLYGPGNTLTLSEPQFSPQYNGVYKQLMQFNIKKKQPNLKMGGRSKQIFLQEDLEMAKEHMKRCSTPLIIREMQIKHMVRYHFTLVRMAIIKKKIYKQ